MICATRSAPYSRRTYSITSSRRSWQKSMSKSGMDTRSGFRNRSNSSPKRNGSRSVMVSAHAATDPAPEPRPGPTGMPCALRPLDEVGHDQEVAGEAHRRDHAQLVFQPGRHTRCARSPRRRPSRPCAEPGPPAPSGPQRLLLRRALPHLRAHRQQRLARLRHGGCSCRAMASVLSHASGRSANSARMAAAGLNQCSAVTRRRSGSATARPAAMHSSASWAAYIAGLAKKHSLVATRGNPAASASPISPGSTARSSARPCRCSSTTVRSPNASAIACAASPPRRPAALPPAAGPAARACRR